jgi:hypothetical protein
VTFDADASLKTFVFTLNAERRMPRSVVISPSVPSILILWFRPLQSHRKELQFYSGAVIFTGSMHFQVKEIEVVALTA